MAASDIADELPGKLQKVGNSLHRLAGSARAIGSTVMSPDTPQEEVAQDAALERAVRATLGPYTLTFSSQGYLLTLKPRREKTRSTKCTTGTSALSSKPTTMVCG